MPGLFRGKSCACERSPLIARKNRSNQHTGEPTQRQNARVSRKALLIRYNAPTYNLL